MDTTVSEKLLTETKVATGGNIWGIDLGARLNEFAQSINSINTVISSGNHDENLSLTDAAYILGNVGLLWCRRVEDLAREAQRLLASLSNFDAGIPDNIAGEHQDNKKVRPKRGHPLALFPDNLLDPENFFQKRVKPKVSTCRCLLSSVPSVSTTSYLSIPEPRTIPLLKSERICQYVDDKGNKGLDWAEFRSNIIRLDYQGHFPLVGPFGDVDGGRRLSLVLPANLSDIDFENGDNQTLQDVTLQNCNATTDAINDFPSEQLSIPEKLPAEKPTTLKESDRNSFSVLQKVSADCPFKPSVNIHQLKAEKNLIELPIVAKNPTEQSPFVRRNKRQLKEKEQVVVTPEVDYFQYFWDLHPKDGFYPRCDLKFVFNRFERRLRKVEESAPVKKGRGKGKVVKTVRFVSTENDLPTQLAKMVISEELSIAPKNGHAETSTSDEEPNFHNAAEYSDLGEPCGDEDALNLDMETDHFAEMVKAGAFVQKRKAIAPNLGMTTFMGADDSFDDSICVLPDLNTWEDRLSDFLAIHESNTGHFNLRDYSDRLVANCTKVNAKRIEMKSIAAKGSVGEVCRTFLSLLDLANKNLITFDKNAYNQSADVTISDEFEDLGATICLTSAKMNNVRKQKGVLDNQLDTGG